MVITEKQKDFYVVIFSCTCFILPCVVITKINSPPLIYCVCGKPWDTHVRTHTSARRTQTRKTRYAASQTVIKSLLIIMYNIIILIIYIILLLALSLFLFLLSAGYYGRGHKKVPVFRNTLPCNGNFALCVHFRSVLQFSVFIAVSAFKKYGHKERLKNGAKNGVKTVQKTG